MYVTRRNCEWLLAGLALAACLGCEKPLEVGTVSGVVTDPKGKPLPNVTVIFFPDPNYIKNARRSTGRTDENGKYQLFYQDDQTVPGAAIGRHVVIVEDTQAEENRDTRAVSRVPAKYYTAVQTPLHFEVVAGEQTFDIELE